jgi:regulator of protease activity HflC (stomatin/prohibitin superfamily)
MNKHTIILLALASLGLPSCMKPVRVDPIKEINPNETAFVVPLEAGTENQEKLESVEFLKQSQVAAKRIVIPQRERKIGRFDHNVEWIPTVRVLTVNRTPVTRSWITSLSENPKASNDTRDFGVESKDSIGFSVGVNVSAFIEETDAAKYLYYYRGDDLSEVMDRNVRERVHTVLHGEFTSLTLQESKTAKAAIVEALREDVVKHFKEFGITITSIGLAEGMTFEQPEIQQSINSAYVAEMAVEQAKQKTAEQNEVNKRLLAQAQGEAAAAKEFAAAAEERIKLVNLDIQKIKAEAERTKAEKWDGKMPQFMTSGEGGNFLFQIDKQ